MVMLNMLDMAQEMRNYIFVMMCNITVIIGYMISIGETVTIKKIN